MAFSVDKMNIFILATLDLKSHKPAIEPAELVDVAAIGTGLDARKACMGRVLLQPGIRVDPPDQVVDPESDGSHGTADAIDGRPDESTIEIHHVHPSRVKREPRDIGAAERVFMLVEYVARPQVGDDVRQIKRHPAADWQRQARRRRRRLLRVAF